MVFWMHILTHLVILFDLRILFNAYRHLLPLYILDLTSTSFSAVIIDTKYLKLFTLFKLNSPIVTFWRIQPLWAGLDTCMYFVLGPLIVRPFLLFSFLLWWPLIDLPTMSISLTKVSNNFSSFVYIFIFAELFGFSRAILISSGDNASPCRNPLFMMLNVSAVLLPILNLLLDPFTHIWVCVINFCGTDNSVTCFQASTLRILS